MSEKPFRKSSLERVNSPEQLNDYIRVARPCVWITLAAVILLLVGVVIWGIFGSVNITIDTLAVVDVNGVNCYIDTKDAARVRVGMPVAIERFSGTVTSLSDAPVRVPNDFSEYELYMGDFSKGDFCYVAEIDASDIDFGVYSAEIIVDSVQPISFVIQ